MNHESLSRLRALQCENDLARVQMNAMAGRFNRLRTRHEDGTAPQAVSAFQLFQTPVALAGRLVELLDLSPGLRILEPSAGLGRLLDALQPSEPAEIVAVEVNADCAGTLFGQERAGVTLLQRDFLDLKPEETGLFDAVAMNPPFHLRADIRHILHALTFLKPGGSLAAFCLSTHHREAALGGLASHWEEIPAGAFKSEGTRVETVLLKITR